MSARCPEGHQSESLDYCDVCGSPMGAAPEDDGGGGAAHLPPAYGGAAPAPELPAADASPPTATQTCPHCGALNVADALFCEACGYDFTTGTPPMGSDPVPAVTSDEPDPDGEDEGGEDGTDGEERDDGEDTEERDDGEDSEERDSDEDGYGVEPPPAIAPSDPLSMPETPSEATELGHSVDSADDSQAEPEPGEPVAARPPEEPAAARPAVPAHRKARHTPPSRTLAEAWVVELWVDPDWYAVQQTEEACPSAGVPDTVLLTRSTALVGRPSGSLGVRPEVDVGADSAVSRRHAQLTSDGQRWWVEDLGSSNGTFVGTVGEPLPTEPIPPGQRVEIDRDDRLYVGAWTRIVLRQATESERQGTG